MYNYGKPTKSSITHNKSYQGDTIEVKIRRLLANKEDASQEVKTMYTERKEGVVPSTDIRTDKWDLAIEATDYASRMNTAKREATIADAKIKAEAKIVEMNKQDGEPKPIDGTKTE